MSAQRAGTRHRNPELRYLALAAAVVVGLLLLAYASFVREVAFADHFELRGVFASANQLKPGNPVREAGLDIGSVTGVGPGPGNTSVVTMRIDKPGGLHADASLAIEPRLLFEGNFYVRVNPGTPAAPALRDGVAIPLARTSIPVQLDQVLDVFTMPTREALRGTVAQLAKGLGGPAPQSGAEGMRRAVLALDRALGSITRVAGAAQGTSPGDLHRAVASSADVASQLAQDPAALAGAVTHFNAVAGAIASQDQALADGVRRLDAVLQVAPDSLTAIDRALPVITRFSDAADPGLRAAPGPLRSTNRLLARVDALMQPDELPRLLHALAPVTSSLPGFERRLGGVFSLVTPAARCVSRNVSPVLDQQVPDGRLSTGRPAWQDLLHMGAALTGTSPGFDANGGTLRISIAESEQALGGFIPGIGEVVGRGTIQGVRPTWLGYGVLPPFRPDLPCTAQALPNLAARSSLGPPAGLHAVSIPHPNLQQLASTLKALLDGPPARQRLLRTLLSPTAPWTTAPRLTKPDSGGKPSPRSSSSRSPMLTAGGRPQAASRPVAPDSLLGAVTSLLGRPSVNGQGASTPGNAIQAVLSALEISRGGGR